MKLGCGTKKYCRVSTISTGEISGGLITEKSYRVFRCCQISTRFIVRGCWT